MPMIEGQEWSDEDIDLMKALLDTQTNTTPDGKRRCECRFKGTDYYGDIGWMRCLRPATVRVRLSPVHGDTYESVACDKCAENDKDDDFSDGTHVTILGAL